jgi:hypothetical protein
VQKDQHTPFKRLADCGKYITDHGRREGKPGDLVVDLNKLNNPHPWEAPRWAPKIQIGPGIHEFPAPA